VRSARRPPRALPALRRSLSPLQKGMRRPSRDDRLGRETRAERGITLNFTRGARVDRRRRSRAVAIAGLVVLRFDAHRLFTHLTNGGGASSPRPLAASRSYDARAGLAARLRTRPLQPPRSRTPRQSPAGRSLNNPTPSATSPSRTRRPAMTPSSRSSSPWSQAQSSFYRRSPPSSASRSPGNSAMRRRGVICRRSASLVHYHRVLAAYGWPRRHSWRASASSP
jgi:hypothetical protein